MEAMSLMGQERKWPSLTTIVGLYASSANNFTLKFGLLLFERVDIIGDCQYGY
jgi:hypothetical protein